MRYQLKHRFKRYKLVQSCDHDSGAFMQFPLAFMAFFPLACGINSNIASSVTNLCSRVTTILSKPSLQNLLRSCFRIAKKFCLVFSRIALHQSNSTKLRRKDGENVDFKLILILIWCYFGENLSALKLSLRGATCHNIDTFLCKTNPPANFFSAFDINNLGQWQLELSTEILINKTTFLNFTNITRRTSVIFVLTVNKHLAWNYAALT